MTRLEQEKDEWKDKYDDQKKVVSEYVGDIQSYETNLQLFQEGHYDQMLDEQGVFLANFKLQTDNDLKNKEAEIEKQKTILKTLKDLKKKYNTDMFDEQITSQTEQLNALKQSFADEKATIETGNTENTMTWLAGIETQLYKLTGKKYEFESLGDGTIQMYIDGVKKKKPIAEAEIETFATNLVKKANKNDDSKKSGENLIDSHTKGTKNAEKQKKGKDAIKEYGDSLLKKANRKGEFEESGKDNIRGINKGIQNQALQNEGKKAMSNYAKSLQDTFNKENKTHSPSRVYEYWASMIPAGITKGIEENQDSSLLAIKNMANEMYDEMKKSVNISTGEFKSDAIISSNHSYNNTIVVNTKVDGSVDMDGKSVGRITAPYITKTIKSGGIR